MKKFTKKLIKIASIVATSAVVLFGGAMAINAVTENLNNEKINETRLNYEKNNKENIDKIKEKYSKQPFDYERKEITNDKIVDFSKFTVPATLFGDREGYIMPIYISSSLTAFKNFERNKHLYVYMDNNLSANEKEAVRAAVTYLNLVISCMDYGEYSVTIANKLEDSNTYIHVINDQNATSRSSLYSDALGMTELYESSSPLYYKPIAIRMCDENIKNACNGNYDALYKGTFIHEFLHAVGFDHSRYWYDNEHNDLIRPIMCASAYKNMDYLSIPELADLFSWYNKSKYAQAKNEGKLQDAYNNDFLNYLSIIQYGLNHSLYYHKQGSALLNGIKDNQVIQFEYNEKEDDDTNSKSILTLNYPYKNFCEKVKTKADGSVEKLLRPFVITHDSEGKGRIIVLNENCRSHDEIIKYNEFAGSYLYKDGLTYDEVFKELRTMDQRNGVDVYLDGNHTKEKHVTYETKNLWNYITNTTTKNDIKIDEQLYKITYRLTWTIDDIAAEETTNYIKENKLADYNITYVTNAEETTNNF